MPGKDHEDARTGGHLAAGVGRSGFRGFAGVARVTHRDAPEQGARR